MTYTVDERFERISERYDPDDLVDILNLSSKEIIEAFPDKVLQYMHLFDWGENDYDEDEDIKETGQEV